MTAAEFKKYELYCDAIDCQEAYGGMNGQGRAAVRKQATERGWACTVGYSPKYAKDYCPAHKAEAQQ